MSNPTVVITAMHAISALGLTPEQMVSALNSPSGPANGRIQKFDFHSLDREYPFYRADGLDPVSVLGKKGLRTKDWATKLLLSTLELGFKNVLESFPPDNKPGLCVGTAFGSVQSIGDFLSDSIVSGVNAVNPMLFGNTVINSPTGNANIRFELKELSATVSTGFNGGLDAIVYAADHIRCGYAEALVAGGLEEVSYYEIVGFQRAGLLSRADRARPFAAEADGVVLGEGCALFLLENEESARRRGARIIAEVAGVASVFDPDSSGFNPAGTGARSAVEEACRSAGISPERIGFVAASASGYPGGDAMEAAVLRSLLPSARVAAYKARFGECYGASGALSLACALLDLQRGQVSGVGSTYNVCQDVCLSSVPVPTNTEYALVNSFGCDGNCTCVVLRKRT